MEWGALETEQRSVTREKELVGAAKENSLSVLWLSSLPVMPGWVAAGMRHGDVAAGGVVRRMEYRRALSVINYSVRFVSSPF